MIEDFLFLEIKEKNLRAKLESDEVGDVVVDGFALLDCAQNRREIVVAQNHVCCF